MTPVLEVLDAAVRQLIDPTAALERLADGFQFTEGPVWHPQESCLYFSDIPANTIYRYTDQTGAQVYRQPSHFSNGLTVDAAGRLLACEHRGRRVSRTVGDKVETVVSTYQGRRLNSPNDLFVAGDGSIYFTDPHYGLLDGLGGPAEQEQPCSGVYRIPPGAAEPVLLADDFAAPNGLALSPDGTRLYVSDTVRGHVRSFDVGADGRVGGGAPLVDLPADAEGVPDGLKLDVAGNLYCTGPGGIWICAPTGAILGRIRMPEVTANLNWGDADRRTLYITASTGIYRLRTLVQGLVRP